MLGGPASAAWSGLSLLEAIAGPGQDRGQQAEETEGERTDLEASETGLCTELPTGERESQAIKSLTVGNMKCTCACGIYKQNCRALAG